MKGIMLSSLKKTIALLSVFSLLLVYLPVTVTAAEDETVTIYRETFANGKGVVKQSGGASLTVEEKAFEGNADGKALYVSNRSNDFDAADFFFDDIGLVEGETYTITVKGYIDSGVSIPDGANVQIQPAEPEYGWVDGKQMAAGETFTLSGTYTVDKSIHSRLRVQSNEKGKTVPFYIGEITIKGKPVVVYHESFADGIGDAAQSGGASLTAVNKTFEGNDDGKALYVSNRVNNWDAADFSYEKIGLKNGKTYSITIIGYVDAGVTVPAGGQAWMQPVSNSEYGSVLGADFVAGQPFTISGSFTVDTDLHDRIRINSSNDGASVPYYIGEIIIKGEPLSADDGEEPGGPGQTLKGDEVYHETFAEGIGKAKVSGGASLTAVDKSFAGYEDGKALYVSNRSNNWDAADFQFSDLGLLNGETYTITVTGYIDSDEIVPEGANVQLQPVDPQYGWVDGKQMKAGQAFTLRGTYTVNADQHKRLRVQSNDEGKTVPFYIGDILITQGTTVIHHEDFASGKGKAVQSGGASLTAVDKAFAGYDDGKALYVSNRSVDYDAADFVFTDVKMAGGGKYSITVKGYIDPDVEVTTPGARLFIKTNNTYTELASVDVTTGAAFTMTCEYMVDGAGNDTAFRVQSNSEGAGIPFYIGDVSIAKIPLPFTTVTFEGEQEDGGFEGRSGNETLTVTDEANHTEGGSKALKVEGRSDSWHGPSLRVEQYISEGNEYKVTVWVKLIEPANAELQLSTQVGSSSYYSLDKKTVTAADGWVKLEGTYLYSSMKSNFVTIYVESPNSKTASFYIDDVSFIDIGSGPLDIQKDLTPIKNVYTNDFLIGNAISEEDLSGVRLELLTMHHNVATAGNAMKPDALQKVKGTFTFTAADEMVDKVLAEGMQMHGHTLVWHSQSPDWMNKNAEGGYLGREEALTNLRNHIRTVVEHFGDKVISWDVVNEAMNDNPADPSDWEASLRQSPWYHAIGSDYIEQAFLAAREVLDEHPDWDIKLYYNDYNDDNQNKATAIYNMVRELNEKYAQTHPGKKLIDGIGMQAHYNLNTNPENVRLSLEKFINLGVEVSVTELDIMAGENSKISEDQAKAQAYLYAQLFKIYKEHSGSIARVTFWGMDDRTSWRASNNPLLFDRYLQAKPAYYAVIDPDKYMEENPPAPLPDAKQGTARYGTPVVDGVIDSIWSTTEALPVSQYQAAWQGASGKAKVLWDSNNLYVLLQVNDTVLDKSSPNAWEQDSVEVFLDENNAKSSFYQPDDGQYRVSFDNETSFNPAGIEEGFESVATTTAAASYLVEMKIPFKTITPAKNTKIGFDAQINDGENGARISVATWNDLSGNAYQDTSKFGVLTLIGQSSGGDSSSGSSSSGGSSPSAPAVTQANGEVSVTVPVSGNSDGSMTANVTNSHIDALVKAAAEAKKENAGQASTIRLELDTSSENVTAKLPEKALEKILTADPDALLEIAAGQFELGFDSKALEAISNAGAGAAEINVSRLDPAETAEISSEAAEKIADRPVLKIEVSSGDNAVTDFNGGTLTVSIPYALKEGEDPNAILVYYIDSNNNLVPVISRYVDGKVIFTTTHLSVYAVGYNKVSFTDVKQTDYFYAPVTYLGARGAITGAAFEPKRAITRGEAIVMIMKAYGIKPMEDPTDNFSDASGEYAGYYAKAKAIGLSKGVGNNKIGADLLLTREMLFTMVSNMESVIGEFPTAAGGRKASSFSDYNELSGWSVASVSKLTEKGIVIGTGNNVLKPKADATRSETATMLYRLLNK